MPFIPNNKAIKVGDKVILTEDRETCAGVFTTGTFMTCTAIGERGYSFVDTDGNCLVEAGWSGFARSQIDD